MVVPHQSIAGRLAVSKMCKKQKAADYHVVLRAMDGPETHPPRFVVKVVLLGAHVCFVPLSPCYQ